MIKLLKNEFRKLFRKKIIYATLVILFIVILVNTIIGTDIYNGIVIDQTEEALNRQELELTKKLDKINISEDIDEYIETKTNLELVVLHKKYQVGSWQEQAIIMKVDELKELLTNINICIVQNNEKKLNIYQKQYNDLLTPIENDDWKEFAKNEIYRYQNSIDELNMEKEKLEDREQIIVIENQIKEFDYEIKFLQLRLSKNISFENNTRNKQLKEYKDELKTLEEYPENYGKENYNEKMQYNKTLKNVKELEYKIYNNISILEADNARDMLVNSLDYYEIIIIAIIIIISGTIISEEFNKGTIKLLLIKPYKRWQILLAKILTLVIMIFMLIVITFLLQFIIGGIVYNFSDYLVPIIEYDFSDSTVISMNVSIYFINILLAKLPMYMIILVTTLMISILFSSSSVAIILGMLLYISKYLIHINESLEFIKYFVAINWDFSIYLYGNLAEVSFLNKNFSLLICLVSFLIVCCTSFIYFNNKDIKNI